MPPLMGLVGKETKVSESGLNIFGCQVPVVKWC